MATWQSASFPSQPSTPTLVLEREPQIALLRQYADEAAAGNGRLVFVGGEMGIGKTTLVERFRDTLPNANQVPTVSCDGLHVSGPLGPLMDVAHALGPGVEHLLVTRAPREEVFRAVIATLEQAPGLSVLVGEDVHWGDDASLDLLYYLGRRIGNTRTLFIATYRDDEIPVGHPLRRVLGDLATAPGVRRMILPPLSEQAVATLAAGTAIDPVELRAYTAGNPFMVREILDAGTTTPVAIQDAILARASRLSPDARSMLESAATIGVSVDPDLLRSAHGSPIDGTVEECLAVGLFRPTGKVIEFRHAAVRDAIAHTISPVRRLALHRQAYAASRADSRFDRDHALLAFHAEEAANGTAAFKHAVAAAREASRYESHREAVAQYLRALRHCPSNPPGRRADLLKQCAYESYLSGDMDQAVRLQEELVRIRQALKDDLSLGDDMRVLSRYYWSKGVTSRAMEFSQKALQVLEAFPESQEFARACSAYSQLCMLAHNRSEAVEWGNRAMSLARDLGDTATLVHAMTNVGAASTMYQGEEATRLLVEARDLAEAEHLTDDAARAMIALAWDAAWGGDVVGAERYLEHGIAYTDAHDLTQMHHYLLAIQAQHLVSTGDWSEGSRIAQHVLDHQTAIPVAMIVALVAKGLSRVRRGDFSGDDLDQALERATPTMEFQRLGPVRAARAEAAWLVNDLKRTAVEANAVMDLARERPHPWFSGSLAMWRWRSGQGWPDIDDHLLGEPYRLLRAGDWHGAAESWRKRGNHLEEARALASSSEETDLKAALAILDRIGAPPDAQKVTTRLRDLGFRNIPRGPRAATRAAFGMLTPREVDVLDQMASGATNADIAQRLYLSKRTVEHHVSSILAKLNVATRGEAVARGREAGVVSR
jgi:DNA-binding CsgD family transcriptional regulator/tetratricopeptide (TPR) repeat protein